MNSWTREEQLVCAAHIIGELENEKEFLKDYDYEEMTSLICEIISVWPTCVPFQTHVENCILALEEDEKGKEPIEWTIEYFTNFSRKEN